MIKVNLVPSEILAKSEQKHRALQAGVVGFLLVLLVIGISFLHWFKLERLEKTLAEDAVKLKKLEVIVAKVEQLEREAKAVRDRLAVIETLLKGRSLYPYFMSDFVRSVPLGVRVKTLTTTGGGSAASPLRLSIAAESRSNEDIAGWVRKMEDSGKFLNVELGGVTGTEGAERVYNFTLTTLYTPTL